MNRIHELAAQGHSIYAIATALDVSRNTIRKYLRNPTERIPRPRRKRGSKLDPFKQQIQEWITNDHLHNCETMLPRLQAMGYTGSLSLLKAFVHPLRPPAQGQYPVQRYETKPGEQMQFDWGRGTLRARWCLPQTLRFCCHFRIFSNAFCHLCETV